MGVSTNGIDLQVAICGYLKDMGFRVMTEEEWDHAYKLDFLISRFPKYPKTVSVGVQITSRLNDEGKRAEFVVKNTPGDGRITVADRALYLEWDERVQLNKGGAELVSHALSAFHFDSRFADTKVWAVRIFARDDAFGYIFYDPLQPPKTAEFSPLITNVPKRPAVANLNGAASNLKRVLGGKVGELEGRLHSLFLGSASSYGFISAQDGQTYHFKVSDITDSELRESISVFQGSAGKTSVNFEVIFDDHGKTRTDVLYRSAKNVRLLFGASSRN